MSAKSENKSAEKTAANTDALSENNENQTETASVKNKEQTKQFTAKDIDIHQYITVRNGFQGRLVYKSPKTGEHFVWDGFGSEQEMELLELRNAKNAAKKFFVNNWFMFDEDWIVDYLGLRQYYKHAVGIEDFDKIFKQPPASIKKTIEALSDGQKKSVAYRAKVLIAEGGIDSNKAISALEETLGVELVER